ncbi:MAG TPA: exodeoxyribonuclease VII large subunit [Candidatus Saccharimonadales bacterium]|nr:exodeoxyribonuclease VII large subunit [Candidatus Saccharimonadales bacterium]
MQAELALGVSEFVALLNQTLEYAYPIVTITGELANFRVSKNRWVYFDLKDDAATVRFFGTVYQLPGPLEDGMLLAVTGNPRLHALYGFSVNVVQVRPVGEGSIKKAANLLEAKLAAEGLFDPERKRLLPYPPRRIGLITSSESAAYRDFMKILNARWGGVEVTLIDVQVQGAAAVEQITAALQQFNQLADPPDVLVVTRGGGSAEDLQAFSTEQVTRGVAASRIPTLVAIGHEIDVSLAELAADQRASTPSNAAELLVPDRKALLTQLAAVASQLARQAESVLARAKSGAVQAAETLYADTVRVLEKERRLTALRRQMLQAFDPQAALHRGYALVRLENDTLVASGTAVAPGSTLSIELYDARVTAIAKRVTMKQRRADA